MNKYLILLISGIFILAGCATSTRSGEVDEKIWANYEEPLRSLGDPTEDAVQNVMREAAEKEDWLGAVPKLQKIIDDGIAEHEFAEDSIMRTEIDRCIFKCMLIARKYDEALKFAERLPYVQEELAEGKNFKRESSIVILESGTFAKYGLKGKGMSKMDAYLKRSDIPTEDRQRVTYVRALASLLPPGDPEKFIKRLEETRDVDPESKIGKLAAEMAEEAKAKLEDLKKGEKQQTE